MRGAPLAIAAAIVCAVPGADRTTIAQSPRMALRQPGAPVHGLSSTRDTALRMGSYVSSRIDNKKPPVRDVATDDRGIQYLIEFDELVLTLRASGEFRAALRYRQTLARQGEQTPQEPLQRMTVHGSWFREGGILRFVPDPKRGGDGLRILNGTFTGRTVSVPFDYRNGRVTRRSTVLLVFDPSII